MKWLGAGAFMLGALFVGLGLTVWTGGTLLVVGIVLAAAGFVMMKYLGDR